MFIDPNNITPQSNHNSTLLVLCSIFLNILSHVTQQNISLLASILAIIGGVLAIINYCFIFHDRWKKRHKK